jgi:hypothetical protein
MSERMADERLAVLEKELMRTPLQPYQQKAIELLQALKAERKEELDAHVKELKLRGDLVLSLIRHIDKLNAENKDA